MKLSPEDRKLTKTAVLTLLVNLIVALAAVQFNNIFIIQPQISRLNERVESVRVNLSVSPDEWNVINNTTACRTAHGFSALRIDVTSTSPDPLHVLRIIINFKGAGVNLNKTIDRQIELKYADAMAISFPFSGIPREVFGLELKVTVMVVTAELPLQLSSLACVIFS